MRVPLSGLAILAAMTICTSAGCSAAQSQARESCIGPELHDSEVTAVAITAVESKIGKIDRKEYQIDVRDRECGYVVLFTIVPHKPDGFFSVLVDRAGNVREIRPGMYAPPAPREK